MDKLTSEDLQFLSEEMGRLGVSKKSIADHVQLTPRTVYAHLSAKTNYFNKPIHDTIVQFLEGALEMRRRTANHEIDLCKLNARKLSIIKERRT